VKKKKVNHCRLRITSRSDADFSGFRVEICKWDSLAAVKAKPRLNDKGLSQFQARRYMMLVLSRKIGETIQIDDDIFVTVSEVKGGRVRLSIEAPKSVRIVRKEILEREFDPEPTSFVLDLAAPSGVDCLN